MKVAILDHNPEVGGAEASILALLKGINRSQFHVTVILPSNGGFGEALQRLGVPTEILPLPMGLLRLKRGSIFRSMGFLFVYLFHINLFFVRLWAYLRKNKFDLVLTNTVKAHFYGSVAACLCSIPSVWRFHDLLSPDDFSPLLIKCIRLWGQHFPRRVFAVSKIARDYLIRYGFDRRKVEVIPNGIDQERLAPLTSSPAFPNELNIENGTRLIGCLGRIMPQKGQRVFLLAIPEVVHKYPKTLFLIIGDVFLKQEEYKRELLALVREMGVEEKVKFTGFRSDLGDVLRSLDIVVFPSIAPESFGLSVLEAMYHGKPVIASEVGGVSELIEDGVTGMLVEPNHPEQIAGRIIHLLDHPEVYDSIGQRAKEIASRDFSLKSYVASMEKAFREAIANGQ